MAIDVLARVRDLSIVVTALMRDHQGQVGESEGDAARRKCS